MKDSRQFTKATSIAYLTMFFFYSATIVIAYGSQGADTPGFLPDVLGESTSSKIVSVLVLLHLIVAYIIAVQPLHVWFHKTICPKTLYKNDISGTRDWFIITFAYTLFGFCIANLIPFFADLQALIGTLLGAPIMFGWPPLLYSLAKRQETESTSINETFSSMGMPKMVLCGFMMFVLVPIFLVVGTWGECRISLKTPRRLVDLSIVDQLNIQSTLIVTIRTIIVVSLHSLVFTEL